MEAEAFLFWLSLKKRAEERLHLSHRRRHYKLKRIPVKERSEQLGYLDLQRDEETVK